MGLLRVAGTVEKMVKLLAESSGGSERALRSQTGLLWERSLDASTSILRARSEGRARMVWLFRGPRFEDSHYGARTTRAVDDLAATMTGAGGQVRSPVRARKFLRADLCGWSLARGMVKELGFD